MEEETILFTSTRWEEIAELEKILRCFWIVSRLKISLLKSLLKEVGGAEENIQLLEDTVPI